MTDDLALIRWDAPGPYRVAFTTRQGGVSEGPFDSLNLAVATALVLYEIRRTALQL